MKLRALLAAASISAAAACASSPSHKPSDAPTSPAPSAAASAELDAGVAEVPDPSTPADTAAIASVYKARCGSCHTPVPVGARTRAHLARAFIKHRKRVRLSEDQWSALIDFLGKPDPVSQ